MQFFKKEGEEEEENGLEYLMFKCSYWLKNKRHYRFFLRTRNIKYLTNFKLYDFCSYNCDHKEWDK